MIPVILGISVISAFFLTGWIRKLALKHQLVDIPNQRSSHKVPTPKSGGLAIAAPFIAVLILQISSGQLTPQVGINIMIASASVLTIGFIDDYRSLGIGPRLLIHTMAGALIIYTIGPIDVVIVDDVQFELGIAGILITLILLIWTINLFNFMDGINGLASFEWIFSISAGIFILLYATDVSVDRLVLFNVITASVVGFLIWNFPVAKIFMGDSGSGFLGIMFGTFWLLSYKVDPLFLWITPILLAVFIVDATITLIRRIISGKRFYQAHREHTYQKLADLTNSHSIVTLGILLINCLWLFPLAFFCATRLLSVQLAMTLAFAPLIMMQLYYSSDINQGVH